MITKFLNLRSVQLIVSALIILGALVCIFTPNYYLFKMGARFAGSIMLGYLALGIMFLIIKQPRLMFTSFACCVGLCVFLKYASNADLKHATPTDAPKVSVASFNVSAFDGGNFVNIIQKILDTDADVVTFHELVPAWEDVLQEALPENYPYFNTVPHINPFGVAVFSKHPIIELDTFFFEDIPNFNGVIELGKSKEKFRFICAHTTPPLYSVAYQKMEDHLLLVSKEVTKDKLPVLTFGSFNAPPWWQEIQHLRTVANLSDSRRSSALGLAEVFNSPGDYIFYNKHFECLNFRNILGEESAHLGIQGIYEFKPHAKKTN